MIKHLTVEFELNSQKLLLTVPQLEELKKWHEQNKALYPFPYWAKVWPAAKALSKFIVHNRQLIAGKQVMEIAAGLGLPSIVASFIANNVYATDAMSEAVEFIDLSIQLNNLTNIKTGVFNWNEQINSIEADVLLMSDVNYKPADFPPLLTFIQTHLMRGATILLSTPQRLIAKQFIGALVSFIALQEEIFIEDEEVMCSVYVLKMK